MKVICNVCKEPHEEKYYPKAYNGATIPICEFCANFHYSTTKSKIRNPQKLNPFVNQFLVDLKELAENTLPYFKDFNKRFQSDMEIAGESFLTQTYERVVSLLNDFPLIEYFYKDLEEIFSPSPLLQVMQKKEVEFFLAILNLDQDVYDLIVKLYYLEVILWFLGNNFAIKKGRINKENLLKNCPKFEEFLTKNKELINKINPHS